MVDISLKKIFLTEEEIENKVAMLGQQITRDYQGEEACLVGILKGSVIFMADLIRHIKFPVTIDFMGISSYGFNADKAGRVKITHDITESITGRRVLLVEDIIDTGLTLSYLIRVLESRLPREIKVCTLLDRSVRRIPKIKLDYVGFEVPDVFVVGYGLDFQGRYRNLRHLAIIDQEFVQDRTGFDLL